MFCPSVKFLSLPHSLRGHVRRRPGRRVGGGWGCWENIELDSMNRDIATYIGCFDLTIPPYF